MTRGTQENQITDGGRAQVYQNDKFLDIDAPDAESMRLYSNIYSSVDSG